MILPFLIGVDAPDQLADAFGISGTRVEGQDPVKLQTAIEDAIEAGGPSLIEVPVGEMPYPY